MELARAILTPGYYAARRLASGYVRLIEGVKGKLRHNRREFFWLFWAAPVVEHAMVFTLGAISGLLGLTLPMLIILLIYPVAGVGDMYLWRSVYGRLAEGVRHRTPLLLNLDMLYWLAIGYVAAWLLLSTGAVAAPA